MPNLLNKLISQLFRKPAPTDNPMPPEEEVLLDTVREYSEVIAQYIPISIDSLILRRKSLSAAPGISGTAKNFILKALAS
jgi:hypothetical protein